MKIKMLATTYWGGKRLKPGDITDVDEAVVKRWTKAGIAERQPAQRTDKGKG